MQICVCFHFSGWFVCFAVTGVVTSDSRKVLHNKIFLAEEIHYILHFNWPSVKRFFYPPLTSRQTVTDLLEMFVISFKF